MTWPPSVGWSRPPYPGCARDKAVLAALRSGPLAEREFRLLFTGQSLSVIGDGITPIADRLRSPRSDRIGDRPRLRADGQLPADGRVSAHRRRLGGPFAAARGDARADAVRATTQATTGVLLLTGSAQLWQLIALQVVYGIAAAFFSPAVDLAHASDGVPGRGSRRRTRYLASRQSRLHDRPCGRRRGGGRGRTRVAPSCLTR